MLRTLELFALALVALSASASVASKADDDAADSPTKFIRPASIPYPDSDPYSAAKYQLGKDLFFEKNLSGSRSIACASCHLPDYSWTDSRSRAQGEGANPLPFRSPTLLNVAWSERLGWDGKFRSLESVAFAPMTNPANMNMTEASVVARLESMPEYREKFTTAFEDGAVNRANIESALATFERSIVSGTSFFDRWVQGDSAALGEPAKRGFEVFTGKGHCAECHSGWAFTDGSFHDIGSATGDSVGRGKYFPDSVKLRYAFKTPTLRNVARRPPYMHDGSIASLEAVIDLYDKGGIDRPSRAEYIEPLRLTATEKSDLLAFLVSLNDEPLKVGGIDTSAQETSASVSLSTP